MMTVHLFNEFQTQDTGGVRQTNGHLCFERAPLQPCRKQLGMNGALAPEGCFPGLNASLELSEKDSYSGGLH